MITQTALVNSWKLYNDTTEKIKLNDFKLEIVEALLPDEQVSTPAACHRLEELDGRKRSNEEDVLAATRGCPKNTDVQMLLSIHVRSIHVAVNA